MPGIASAASAVATTAQRNNDHHLCNGTPSRNARHSSSNGFWSKHQQELTYNQLQKFWSELSPQSRQKILRIDKQTLFEQARKNMYCSRCHGLLLEGFLQIVMYGKSLQQEKTCNHNSSNSLEDGNLCTGDGCPDDIHDSSVHPWGGLTTQNGMLTLLDCYLYTTSLNGLQNVFDRARARERERELLYPDACGGDGRGWVSQEMGGYGRVHGTRESCALHTARLSVETLVDFWSALGEETRKSLLRMKEEDFIERLMYRFDSKRFCRDCRRNVIREFKELKELKRVRREIRCTTWFCVADAAFLYQVSYDTILVDWHEAIGDSFGTYHHFEWAVGTGEGKSDILEFENVGLNGRVQVKGLDLSAINSCYITLRGWKMDGRCTELSVKAHALKGQRCVHRRLMVGDGFVSITRGESIIGFFEQAEDAEEEEDDDLMDKDGNDIDGEYSRPQRHAKSPELAREFLLDAATVIFKEQIEKAFREGTARQNARSIFVCLSLKLLEERLHVACKEILTLEKQMKLLEEEEKEKREEEERKERKRTKEREKKLRRKERLREKEKDKGINCSESNQDNASSDVTVTEQVLSAKVDNDSSSAIDKADSVSEAEEAVAFQSLSSEIQEEQPFDEFFFSDTQADSDRLSEEHSYANNDCSDPHPAADHLKYPHLKLKCRQEVDACSRWSDRRGYAIVSKNRNMVCKYEPKKQVPNFDSSWSSNSLNKQPKSNRPYIRIGGPKSGEKFTGDRYESHSCSCRQYKDNGAHVERQTSRVVREIKPNSKLTSVSNASNRPYYRHNQAEYVWDKCGRSKNSSSCNQDYPSFVKKVWEPLESSPKKHPPHINSDHGVSSKSCHSKGEATAESDMFSESCVLSSCQEAAIETSVQKPEEKKHLRDTISTTTDHAKTKLNMESKEQQGDPCTVIAREDRNGIPPMNGTSSNSENLSSSCLSEGDSTTFSSNAQSTEFSSSDSEDASQNSEGREPSACVFPVYQNGSLKKDSSAGGGYEHAKGNFTNNNGGCTKSCGNLPPSKSQANIENEAVHVHASIGPQPQILPAMHSNHSIHFPFFQAPAPPPPPPMGYYHQGSVEPWPAEASPANGFMAFPYPSQYVYAHPNGYGLMNGNVHFMPYSPLQHLSPPMLHVPAFQPVVHNNNNDVALKDYAVAPPNLDVLKAEAHPEANVSSWMPMPSSAGTRPPPEKAEEDRKTGKSDVGKDGFSLFHFGGPVPLSTGFMSDLVSLKKEIGDDTIPSKLGTAGEAEGDDGGACKKNTKIEEYNLFASSNGIKFSIF